MQEGSGCCRSNYKLEKLFNFFEYYKEKYLIATSAYEQCEITVKRKNTSWIREKFSWETDISMLIDKEDIRDIKCAKNCDNLEDEKLESLVNKFKKIIDDNKARYKDAKSLIKVITEQIQSIESDNPEKIQSLSSNLVKLEEKLANIYQDTSLHEDLKYIDEETSQNSVINSIDVMKNEAQN